MKPDVDCDVLIVGGGMVGASLACALGNTGLRVALVEAQDAVATGPTGLDTRSIALAEGTRRIFETLGVWSELSARAAPIRQVHISDRGRFGVTRLNAAEHGFDALGYVADIGMLAHTLTRHAEAQANVQWLCPGVLESLEVTPDCVQAQLQVDGAPYPVRAALVVGADGARSAVREQLGIATTRWDYGQTAIIANLQTERPHQDTAFERFTDTGPLALLPLPCGEHSERRCGIVWTVRSNRARTVLDYDDEQFRAAVQERFGFRLGAFQQVSARQAYPLSLTRAKEHVRPRVALIGNAAHTLHPVAGQGFNLGMRDVAVLAELLADARDDVGDWQVLQRYARWRSRDQRTMIAFTDGLARVFSNPLPGIGLARDLGLLAVDMLPPLKQLLMRHTMGMAGHMPRLARGLSLAQDNGGREQP